MKVNFGWRKVGYSWQIWLFNGAYIHSQESSDEPSVCLYEPQNRQTQLHLAIVGLANQTLWSNPGQVDLIRRAISRQFDFLVTSLPFGFVLLAS
jgi:hypothetical protein